MYRPDVHFDGDFTTPAMGLGSAMGLGEPVVWADAVGVKARRTSQAEMVGFIVDFRE